MTCCWRPMPVSDNSSWMSSSRHVTPLSWYSDSPSRNSVRVIVTSVNSIGSSRAVLSMVSDTSDRPSADRSGVPAKMTSSMRPPRTVRGPWAPSTQATASTRFDLPEPFGPTTTVTPGSNSSTVLSANDLKPRRVRDLRNTREALLRNLRQPSDRTHEDRARRGRFGENRALADAKPLLPDRRLVDHVDAVDAGPPRPSTAPREDLVDGARRALEHDLDPAVGEAADPTRDPGGLRLVPARLPEPHPLHPAGDHGAAPDDAGTHCRDGDGYRPESAVTVRPTWHASQKNVD